MNKINILKSKLTLWNLTPLFKMENYKSCFEHYDFRCNKCGDVFNTTVDSLRHNNKGCNKCRLSEIESKRTLNYIRLLKLKKFSYKNNGELHMARCDVCGCEKSYKTKILTNSYIKKIRCINCDLCRKEREKLKIIQDIKDKNIRNKELYDIMCHNKIVIGGIYKLTSPTGRIYIGQSNDIHSRWVQHKSASKKKHPKLYYSIKKYGFEYFTKEILEICSLDVISEKEKYYIKYFDSFNNGLNSTTGGEDTYIRDDETKDKIRKSLMGKYHGKQNIEFFIDGVLYTSIGDAHRKLGIPAKTIHNRINSNNIKFNNYIAIGALIAE